MYCFAGGGLIVTGALLPQNGAIPGEVIVLRRRLHYWGAGGKNPPTIGDDPTPLDVVKDFNGWENAEF